MSSKLLETCEISDHENIKSNEAKERSVNNPSEEERKQAEEEKERTLRLLSDALKKTESLLVDDPKEFGDQKIKCDFCPLITTDLVKELIRELEKVTFAKNTDPEKDITAIAYVRPGSEDRTIHLCAAFWKKDPKSRSRQGTIIHEVSYFLGYGDTEEENSDEVKKSPQSMLRPLTCNSMASALTSDMDHPESYKNGSYPCCGETSRDTVCQKSKMADNLSGWKHRMDRQRIKLRQRRAASKENTYPSGWKTYNSGEQTHSAPKDQSNSQTTKNFITILASVLVVVIIVILKR